MSPTDKLRMQLTTLLPATSRRWLRLLDLRLADFEVTSAMVVPLILIGRSGGLVNQVTLADQLGVVGPSLVRTLDKLVELGLIRRESDPRDRRAKTLWLTGAGKSLVDRLEARMVEVRREIFANIPVEDIKAALRVHQALIDALAGDDRGNPDA